MSFRNRPGLDRRHRPRWQDELRSQQLIVAGFAVAIAVALGIFGATAWNTFYDSHLREVAIVGSQGFDRDQLDKRTGIMAAELQAKYVDLSKSTGGANNDNIQQQQQLIQQGMQSLDSNAIDSLTTGALERQEAPSLKITVSDQAIDAEISRRSTLPFQLQLSIITVNALPSGSKSTTPTSAEWAAAEKTANDLLAQVKAGADFGKLAKEKSADAATAQLDGLVGWVQSGDTLYGPFFDAAKNASAGDLVGPVKGDVGYAIVKVDAVRQAAPDPNLKANLAAVHATDADYREYVRDALLDQAYRSYFADTVVTKDMPQQQIAQIKIQPDSGAPATERVRHILIQPIPGSQSQSAATKAQWDAALAEAKAVRAELVKTGDWAALAKAHGDDGTKDFGGDLGWYNPSTASSTLDADFVKGMLALKFQEISQPVITQFGYHIIQVYEKRTSAEALANAIYDEVSKAPDTFAAVAKRESSDTATSGKGGDIGWIAPYEKDAAFEKAVFALKTKGEIGKPVTLSDGIYIFKLLDSSSSRPLEDSRRSNIQATGFSNWSDQLKAEVGVWVDPQLQTASGSSASSGTGSSGVTG